MGRRKSFGEFPFILIAAIVGALTVGLIVLGLELGWGSYTYLLVIIPIAIAAAYLVSYSKVAPPVEVAAGPTASPGPPSPPGVAGEEEPFVDPVEEADRLASGETLPPPPSD